MESKKYVRNLTESIRSLLGLKTHLNSSWADSVCNIINNLPFEEPSNDSQTKCLNFKMIGSSESIDDDLGSSVSKIQADLAALNDHLNQLNLQRRETLNAFLDLKGNIRVFCRVRPIIEEEKFGHLVPVVTTDSSNVFLKLAENKNKCYSFDKVFHPGSTQDEVFSEVEPVIKSALDGYNACIFAYGQTGTGKTFTMEGKPDCPGVVPRAIEALFKQTMDSNHTFLFTFSMLEIYMGNIRDLLIPQTMKQTDRMTTHCLSIQTDPKGGIEIDNLMEIRVSDFNQAKRLYGLGSRFRSTASTGSNETSSRSHCLTRISLTCFDAPERRRETNKIWMVDLGGSERVLKTKAWGRRFDEGKAINLSLSALGDVISALQRRKSHVPYRNSKLTQVLRDSVGEDSKTLMLVHVSPKEEDMCETVCSLGFATRVRSTHLGKEESSELRAKKEASLVKLLLQMKQLECEHQDVTRNIKRLKEGLGHFTRSESSFDEHTEFHYLSNEVAQCNAKMEKHGDRDVTAIVSSQLPRFMKPTICSRRKSSIDHPSTEYAQKKDSLPPRRRKSSSTRAESVTFPIKCISEYGSENSVSRTSCLADYETEYSHNASECDIKMVIFPKQEKSKRSLPRSKAHLSYKSTKEGGKTKANKIDIPKFLTVDNWLHLQKNEPTNSSNTHGNKRVLGIPLPEDKNRCNRQNKANILQIEDVHNHDFTKEKVFNHNQIEKQADIGVIGSSTMEVVIDETQTLLDDFVTGDSGSNPISVDEKVMEETRELSEFFMNKDHGHCSTSPHDMECDGFIQNKDYDMITGRFAKQGLSDETQSWLESFLVKNSGCSPNSPSDMRNHIINLNKESHEPLSKSQLESKNQSWSSKTFKEAMLDPERTVEIDQKVRTEALLSNGSMTIEESRRDLCVSPPCMEDITSPCLCEMGSHRDLLMDPTEDQDNCTLSFVESQERIHNTGILDLLEQKAQIICASALLGLGVQNLGLGNDFFYGLML